jgi:uncharacterized RDD family membrane protein YckC
MNVIATFFLRAKHWQLFLLLFGIGFVGGAAAMTFELSTARSPEDFLKVGIPFMVVMALFMFCFLTWFWSMGSFLSSIVQPSLRLKMRFFRFALLYPAAYIFVFFALFQSTSTNPALLALIFPLHFFAMFCMFYDLYFVSKSLTMAETQRPASLYDYAGPFFLLWFFPVGVWMIQPRVNRLYLQLAASPTGIETRGLPSPTIEVAPTPDAPIAGIPAQGAVVYGGFWRRFAASLVDCLVMFFPLCVVAFVMIFIFRFWGATHGHDPTLAILIVWPLVTIVLVSSYFAVLESSPWQATLGKIATGLLVSDIEGRRLTLGRATGRTLAKFASSLTLGVGYALCGFTKRKQALHDMIARCLVLRRP